MIADRRLYLTADKSRVVEEGDPEAAFLFTTPGKTISDADVERYGLAPKKAKPPVEEPAEEKQAAPKANKARKSASNK